MTRLEDMTEDQIRDAVAERYGGVAERPGVKHGFPVGREFAESVGYDVATLDSLPEAMCESFTGAGNPQEYVRPERGATLLDLGCGAGLDLYMYSLDVGAEGSVIGLDISHSMLVKARANLQRLGVANARFIEAPAHDIPLEDSSVDIVTANGIYNLSPDKDAVMREVARVLRPGGRTTFAEIVLAEELPGEIRTNIDDWFRCIGGACVEEDFLSRLERAGLSGARVLWKGRNARTGHEKSLCAVVTAQRD